MPTAPLLYFRPSASGKTRHDNQDQTNRKKIHRSLRPFSFSSTTTPPSHHHSPISTAPGQSTLGSPNQSYTPQTATMVQLTEVEDEHFQHAKADDFEDDEDFSDTGTPPPPQDPSLPPGLD